MVQVAGRRLLQAATATDVSGQASTASAAAASSAQATLQSAVNDGSVRVCAADQRGCALTTTLLLPSAYRPCMPVHMMLHLWLAALCLGCLAKHCGCIGELLHVGLQGAFNRQGTPSASAVTLTSSSEAAAVPASSCSGGTLVSGLCVGTSAAAG